jgi:VWFA-related protein
MDLCEHLSQSLRRPLYFLALLSLAASAPFAQVQTSPSPQKPEKSGVAVFSAQGMALADATVFDRQGRFAENLTMDQFEIFVDGKPQPISFFKLTTAGSAEEATEWAKARGGPATSPAQPGESRPDGGRTILFFLDDLHMSADSITRVRTALTRYIDSAVGTNDRIAIDSSSNLIGFLRHLSNDKSELRAAVELLVSHQVSIQDKGPPLMTEAQALAIEKDDPGVLDSFIQQATLDNDHDSRPLPRRSVEQRVRKQASALAARSGRVSETVLSTLVDCLQSYATPPGRKVAFFLSDGFYLWDRSSESLGWLMQATNAANRGGILIYTINPRSLASPVADAGATGAAKSTGRGAPVIGSEIPPTEEGMRLLAMDTGGQFLRNTTTLDAAVAKSLAETSRYYLLGWSFDPAMLRSGNSKSLKIVLRNRPDLAVHLSQNSIDLAGFVGPEYNPRRDTSGDELVKALRSPNPITALPTWLCAGYFLQPEKGPVLTVSFQAADEAEKGSDEEFRQSSGVEIMGAVLSKNGATVDAFRTSISPPANIPPGQQIELPYSRAIAVNPGLYQVRVAARDKQSGRTGSAFEWIEVPSFAPGKFALSSIYIADEQSKPMAPNDVISTPLLDLPLNIKRRFAASGRILYRLQIYNTVYPSDGSAPSVSTQTKIYRGEKLITQGALLPLPTKADADKGPIRFAAWFTLELFTAGAYTLEVTATDNSNNETATQRISFWIR